MEFLLGASVLRLIMAGGSDGRSAAPLLRVVNSEGSGCPFGPPPRVWRGLMPQPAYSATTPKRPCPHCRLGCRCLAAVEARQANERPQYGAAGCTTEIRVMSGIWIDWQE
jgi:hypothetical protein